MLLLHLEHRVLGHTSLIVYRLVSGHYSFLNQQRSIPRTNLYPSTNYVSTGLQSHDLGAKFSDLRDILPCENFMLRITCFRLALLCVLKISKDKEYHPEQANSCLYYMPCIHLVKVHLRSWAKALHFIWEYSEWILYNLTEMHMRHLNLSFQLALLLSTCVW